MKKKVQVSQAKTSKSQSGELFPIWQARFEANTSRHPGIDWADVHKRLDSNPHKLKSLIEMERTGGEPDVVGFDIKTGEFIVFDCSDESPIGRRSTCYDREGWESRKEHRPATSAIEMAEAMGIEILTQDEYRELQRHGPFDTKTSSWLITPDDIRSLGGALFGDHRYGHVFVYHNGAQSYYGARGFRGSLRI